MSEQTLGQRIKAARRRRGIAQADLAAQADVSVDVIRKLEQGVRHTLRMDTLLRIATVLDSDVADLIGKHRGLVVGAEDGEVYQLRRAVLDVIAVDAEPPARYALRAELGEAWRLLGPRFRRLKAAFTVPGRAKEPGAPSRHRGSTKNPHRHDPDG